MSEVTNAVDTEKSTEPRWDESRSVLELCERLKKIADSTTKSRAKTDAEDGESPVRNASKSKCLAVEGEVNKENIARIFAQAANRQDQNMNVALSLAYLNEFAGDLKEWVDELAKGLDASAAVWASIEACAEISDKLPGKQAPFWFDVVSTAKGDNFLADVAMKLPFRLWTHIEKIFNSHNESSLFVEKLQEEINANRITADLLMWIWKSKSNEEMKKKYLGVPSIIFKTLRQDVRGNYLKAQRDLRRMLLENEDFQKQITLNGEPEAIREFIRCIKRVSLLDPSERQSLLVKIANLFPEFVSDIEEKRTGPVRVAVGRLTSVHGYNKRVAELEHLINVEIPENVKAIEIAREHGDLRENSEFKYAKERQRNLGIRRSEWEESLVELQVTDFKNVVIDKIAVPGCTVTIKKIKTGELLTYHVLGLLDSDTDKNIISYSSPLGKLIIGCSAGMKLTLPTGDTAEITEIKGLDANMLKYVADEK